MSAQGRGWRADQLTALLDGQLRFIHGARPPRRWPAWRARAERTQAKADALKGIANRSMQAELDTRNEVRTTPRVLRGLPSWLSASVTVLLMGAGLFTLHAILSVADVPPLESWLLPAAFGPVFVMSTKIFVGWWLGQVEHEHRAGRALARLLVPALLLAFAAAVAGVAVKSMVIGTLAPLGDDSSMVSSAVLFGSVVLMEGVGAAALAARQHAPGARDFEWVRSEYRHARRRADRDVARALNADTVARGCAKWMTGWQEWAAGRAALGLVYGWHQASKNAGDEDAVHDHIAVEDLRITAPPAGFVPMPDPGPPLLVPQFGTDRTRDDIDAEFRRLLAGRDEQDRQDPLW